MGEVLDGVSEHMKDYPEDRIFLVADEKPSNVEKVLKDSGVEILLNYLPVGSDRATQFYAEACLKHRRQPHQLHAQFHRLRASVGETV